MRLIDADEAIINFGFEWDDISPTRDEFVEFIKKADNNRSRASKAWAVGRQTQGRLL